MPKVIDYPRASFSRVQEMAAAIDYLGGSCSLQTCADKMGAKVSGAFTALLGAAKKHSLVATEKNQLVTTPLYKNIKLAYNEEEKRENLRIAFLSPPLYQKLYDRFKGKELPVKMLDKIMVREFGVDQDFASRLTNYFVEGASSLDILVENKLMDLILPVIEKKSDVDPTESIEISPISDQGVKVKDGFGLDIFTSKSSMQEANNSKGDYIVHIYGPGIDSKLSISEQHDFLILEAMILKLKKKFKE